MPTPKKISIYFTFNKYKGNFSRNVSLNVLWYRINIIQINNSIIKQYDLFLFLFVNIQLRLFSLSNIHVPLPANGSLVVGKWHFTSHQTHLPALGSVWLELLLIRGFGGENESVEEAMKPVPEKWNWGLGFIWGFIWWVVTLLFITPDNRLLAACLRDMELLRGWTWN